MRVRLEYGRTGLEVELPDRNLVKCLGYQPVATDSRCRDCGSPGPGRAMRHSAIGRTRARKTYRLHRDLRHYPPRA